MFLRANVTAWIGHHAWSHESFTVITAGVARYVEWRESWANDRSPEAEWLDEQFNDQSPLNFENLVGINVPQADELRLGMLFFCGYDQQNSVVFFWFALDNNDLYKLLPQLTLQYPEGVTEEQVFNELWGKTCWLVVTMNNTNEAPATLLLPYQELKPITFGLLPTLKQLEPLIAEVKQS